MSGYSFELLYSIIQHYDQETDILLDKVCDHLNKLLELVSSDDLLKNMKIMLTKYALNCWRTVKMAKIRKLSSHGVTDISDFDKLVISDSSLLELFEIKMSPHGMDTNLSNSQDSHSSGFNDFISSNEYNNETLRSSPHSSQPEILNSTVNLVTQETDSVSTGFQISDQDSHPDHNPSPKPKPKRRWISKKIHKKRRWRKNCKNRSLNACSDIINHTAVVNLSDRTLTESEKSLLSKNLQFCPTPSSIDKTELSLDLHRFTRRLRLAEFFYDENTDSDENDYSATTSDLFKKPSSFTPKSGRDLYLDSYIEAVESEIMNSLEHKSHSNISHDEKTALNILSHDPDIIIKPADKGGAVVIQNTSDYISECESQLQNDKFYKPLDHDPTLKFNKTIDETLKSGLLDAEIDQDTKSFLHHKTPTPGRFYTLPKIHKEGTPGRPIVSGNNTPTERISKFVDSHLRKFVENQPSYVQDDMDFLRKVEQINREGDLPEGTLLCTLDVSSLYTNIPHDEGIKACEDALNSRPPNIKPSTPFLCTLLRLILTLNNFVFKGLHWLQIHGTSMGTCVAPSYANIFMGKLEKDLLDKFPYKPKVWYRYIDDIFFIWTHGEEKLDEFIKFVNSFHPTIKFTCNSSRSKIPFLDIMIHLINNRLETDLYSKPTDVHQYLHWKSCHPLHTKKGIVYSLTYRLRRICSLPEFLQSRLTELKSFLSNRGYKNSIISDATEKALNVPRNEILKRKSNKGASPEKSRIPFVLTFNPGLPNIRSIITKYFPILHLSDRCKNAIPNVPMMAYKRPKNLKEYLVRATIRSDTTAQPKGFTPCAKPRCKTCSYTHHASTFKSSSTGQIFDIRATINCASHHIIYLITCKKCSMQYVGQTEQTLRDRFTAHRYSVNNNDPIPVAKHFNGPGHSISDMDIIAIDSLPTKSDSFKLCNKETFWIKKLNTVAPLGININSQSNFPINRI